MKGKGSCHTKRKDGVVRNGCYYRRIKIADGKAQGLEFLPGQE